MTTDISFKPMTKNGSIVIAGSWSNKGLFYSEDNGKTWNKSNITSGDFYCLTVIGSTVIAGGYSNNGLYYSEDKGKTWNKSNITSGFFFCLTVIGDTVIASSCSNKGLFDSEDNGKTWNKSNITSGNFNCLTVIGSTVIAGSDLDKGLYYSEDNGHTWQLSNITSGNFFCLTVIGSTIIAGSGSNNGLYYSEDNGKTWKQSNIDFSHFICSTIIGSVVFVSSYDYYDRAKYLYYSEDKGKTWKESNTAPCNFRCLTTINSKVVADDRDSDEGSLYSKHNVVTKEIETTKKVQLIFEFDKNGDVVFNDDMYASIERDMKSIKFNCNGYDLVKRIASKLLESLPIVINIINFNDNELSKNVISFTIGLIHEYIYHKYTILITKPSIELHIKESDKHIKWVTSVNNIILFDDSYKIDKNYSIKEDFKDYYINSKPTIDEQYYDFDEGDIEVTHNYLLSKIINYCLNILYNHFYQKYCIK